MIYKRTVRLLALVAIIAALGFTFGCGGEIEEPSPQPSTEQPGPNSPTPDPLCGNYICDEAEGETYWNCLDCVDLFTGGPKNGYCGDGVCFNETMWSCFRDCRPRAYNPDPGFGDGPDPFPPGWGNPIPGQAPGPMPPDPGPMNPPKNLPENLPKRF
jgi:hypothetical protein